MKLLTASLFLATVAAVVLSGCSKDPDDNFVAKPPETIPTATINPGSEMSLLPLDKGNQWTYAVEVVTRVKGQDQPPRNYESNWKVVESKKTADGIDAVIETTLPDKKVDRQHWRANSKGIYQVADGNPPVGFNPPFPVILFPVKDGTVYKWHGTGPNGTKTGGPQSSERTIRAPQIVDTEMGRMSAFPVEDIGTLEANGKKGKSASTVWLAPGVGIVRLRQEVLVDNQGYVLLIKLKSKALMKS